MKRVRKHKKGMIGRCYNEKFKECWAIKTKHKLCSVGVIRLMRNTAQYVFSKKNPFKLLRINIKVKWHPKNCPYYEFSKYRTENWNEK